MTEEEAERTAAIRDGATDATAHAGQFLDTLVTDKRATRLRLSSRFFWVAAESLPMLRTIYTDGALEPALAAPESAQTRDWERANAVRELIRGRLEVSGPVMAAELKGILDLSSSEIDSALLALEAEGFVLRGRFHPGATEQEWCDRRLLARIHRLTIDRLRAEIQPVTPHEFYRFLFSWQRADAGHRAEGPEGLEAVLGLLDGCELPLAAWEPEVLSARVAEYDPQWLDRLCSSGRVGWGRLSTPQNPKARAFAPLRTSPIALYQRENLSDWLQLADSRSPVELPPDTRSVLDTLAQAGALFFVEIIRRTGLLPTQVEQALAELAALGFVTSDSFDGLRALLVPSDKRPTLGRNEGKRRRKTNLASIEFAGRWSLLRHLGDELDGAPGATRPMLTGDGAMEKFARVLLRRYGVVFRRLLEREPISVSWYELGRIYRRWEARGEIRGGYFIGGVSGEQFALPEAIGLLRSLRKTQPKDEWITLSAADPLNLVGILTPGPRIAALASNRVLFRDGLPIAALEGGETRSLSDDFDRDPGVEKALRIGKLPASLRPYYK
jgi:ATP-dependent Lhr-like helicase